MHATVLGSEDQFKITDRVVEAVTVTVMHLKSLRDRSMPIGPDSTMQVGRDALPPLLTTIVIASQPILATFEHDEF